MGPSSSVHEEFMPGNGVTTVTLSQTPNWILMCARSGVVQSLADGNYSLAGNVITFSDAFDGTERVIVDYASTGYTPVPPIASAGLVGYPWGNADLKADTARLNLLTNGGFEIWQRGNGPYTPAGTMTADRWQGNPSGTTMTVTRETTIVDVGSLVSAKFDITGSVGTQPQPFGQTNKDIALRGRTLSFSIRVRAPSVGSIRTACVWDGTGGSVWTYGANNVSSGVWETLTQTFTVPADATFVWVNVSPLVVGTFYIDNAMLVTGPVAADYAPLHPADDLNRCLRYFELLPTVAGSMYFEGSIAAAGNNLQHCLTLSARKAVTPTYTKVGTWYTANCGQPTPRGDVSVVNMYATATTTGQTAFGCQSAGQYMTVEANP